MKQTFGLRSLSPLLVVLDHQEEYSFCPFPTSATAFGRNGSRNQSDPEEFFLFTALNAASRAWHGGVLFKKKNPETRLRFSGRYLARLDGWDEECLSFQELQKTLQKTGKPFLWLPLLYLFVSFFSLSTCSIQLFWVFEELSLCVFVFYAVRVGLIISLAPAPSYIFIVRSQPTHSSLLPL